MTLTRDQLLGKIPLKELSFEMNSGYTKKPVAIVLGGTVPHKRLLTNLQKRNYYTLLVDYLDNPVACEIADEHVMESIHNKEKVLCLARERNVELVISTCVGQANVTTCYVAEQLHLPAPYSYETALLTTNKTRMKQRMVNHGIPTSRYVVVSDMEQFSDEQLSYPVVVKPVDSNSSKGVCKVCEADKLPQALEEAISMSRSNEAIVEEFKEGVEIGIDCFVANQKANILMTRERRKLVKQQDPILQIQGSVWPTDISVMNMALIKKVAEDIACAFGLDNTPLLIQAIINGHEISVVEFAARIGGGENYRIIELQTGFDLVNAAIDSYLGLPVKVNFNHPKEYYATMHLYTKPGILGEIVGYAELVADGVVEYVDYYKQRGAAVGSELSSNNRVGVVVVRSKDREGLLTRVNTALNSIEVHDIDGRSILRKELYHTV